MMYDGMGRKSSKDSAISTDKPHNKNRRRVSGTNINILIIKSIINKL